jgi:hypothetical protein
MAHDDPRTCHSRGREKKQAGADVDQDRCEPMALRPEREEDEHKRMHETVDSRRERWGAGMHPLSALAP